MRFCTTRLKQTSSFPSVPFCSVLFLLTVCKRGGGGSGGCCCCCVRKPQPVFERREIVLGADHQERERARMPPPPVVCPGCQAHAQHARPHADAQAGRKRQSSWKTRAWSEPTRCSCQAEQLWPASASASLPFTRRHTADLRGKDATIRGAVVHPGRAGGQTPCGGEWEVCGCYSKNSQQHCILFHFLTGDV